MMLTSEPGVALRRKPKATDWSSDSEFQSSVCPSESQEVFHLAIMLEETAWLHGWRALRITCRCTILNIPTLKKRSFIFLVRGVWPPASSAGSQRSVLWRQGWKVGEKLSSLRSSAVCFIHSWRPELQPNPIIAPAWGECNWPVFG